MIKAYAIGRLTADVQAGTTKNGKQYARFTLASNNPNGQADFIDVVAWEKLADVCQRYLTKGKQVFVNGDIVTGSYEKNGQKVKTVDLRATNVEFLDGSKTEPKDAKQLPDDDMPF